MRPRPAQRRLGLFAFAKEPAKRRGFSGKPVIRQPRVEGIELAGRRDLRRIVLDLPAGGAGLVNRGDGCGHEWTAVETGVLAIAALRAARQAPYPHPSYLYKTLNFTNAYVAVEGT